MKRMFAAMFLVLGCGATEAAAPSCWPDASLPVALEIARTPPATVAPGTVVYAASSIGLVYGWACRGTDSQWWKVVIGGPWSSFAPDWLFIADQALRGTVADKEALWNKYNPTAAPIDARLKTDADAIMAMLPSAPAVSEWKVLADPFRSDKRRLVYTVVNGKRGPSTGQYVDAGAPCNPVTTVTEFGPTYFLSVNGNPNTVARCTK